MGNFCSKCGNQLREGANFCNKCGAKVNNTVQEIQESPEEVSYKKACELMKGDLQSCQRAIKEFESLRGFKDSENKIEECNQKINKLKNNIYYLACELMKGDKQSCEKAIKEFESLKGFKDSEEKIKECNIKIRACELMKGDKQSCEKAIKEFQSLNDFKDSEEKIKECKSNIQQTQYDKACSLMFGSQMNYLTAIDIFKSLKDFKDSENKIRECEKAIQNFESEKIYKKACELMSSQKDDNSEDKNKSENFFDKIFGFVDKYFKLNDDLINYNQAISEFNSIRNFKDSEAKINECENYIEKLHWLKQQYIQKFENAFLVILLIGIILYSAFIFIKPYYYRNTFDNILNNGNFNEISILSFDKNFLKYSDDEQKKK